MSFLKTVSRASKGATCAIAMTFLAVSSADAQTTTVINDSFANGFSDLSLDDSELDFFTTSSSSGLNSDSTAAGPIDFASGGSGRAIHGLFAPQTLAAVGDSLEVTFDFTTPATIADSMTTTPGSTNEDFRFGLFSTSRAPNGQADYAMTISSSTGTPNPILELVAGFEGEIDNVNAAGTDLGIRTHNVNALIPSLASTGSASPDGTPSGILMNTTAGFDFISGGPDDEILLVGNTSYTGRIFVALNDATLATLDITVEVLNASGVVISTHTDTLFVDDQADGEIGVNTLSFDMLGFSASSGCFGVASAGGVVGDADNGIDISNVTVTAITTGTSVLLGDVNLDQTVDFLDISPFIAVLSAGGDQPEADVNQDNVVDFLDISPFIGILSGS